VHDVEAAMADYEANALNAKICSQASNISAREELAEGSNARSWARSWFGIRVVVFGRVHATVHIGQSRLISSTFVEAVSFGVRNCMGAIGGTAK